MTLQENSPFCQIFPSISLQVMGISAFPKLLGSLGPGKHHRSSDNAGSFAASQTRRGRPFARVVSAQSLPCGTPTADRHKGSVQVHSSPFLCAVPPPRLTYCHGFYGECSSNSCTRLRNHLRVHFPLAESFCRANLAKKPGKRHSALLQARA